MSDDSIGLDPIRIAILTPSSLRVASGTEMVVLNLAKYLPHDKTEVTIVDTDTLSKGITFLSEEDVAEFLQGRRRITIHDHHFGLTFLDEVSFLRPLSKLLIDPIVFSVIGRIFYRRLFDWLASLDAVILMSNSFAYSLPRRSEGKDALVIATSQNLFGGFSRGWIKVMGLTPFSWLRRVDVLQTFRRVDKRLAELRHSPRIIVLPNGVDCSRFAAPKGVIAHKIRFVIAGRLISEKGVLKALSAWKRMSNRSKSELHVVGAGPLDEMLKTEMDPNYFFHGPMPSASLAKVLQDSDVLLHLTSDYGDTFGLIVLEALACGNYCMVGTTLRGLYDDFVSRGHLEYVDPDNPSALTARLEMIAENPIQWQTRKDDRHKLVQEKYDWKEVALDYFEAIVQ